MINKNFIDKLLSDSNIVDVAQKIITTKFTKSGANYKTNSPFNTKDKTPSFSVNEKKQCFKCFSSGNGGKVVTLIMSLEKLTYPEAIEWLAEFMNRTVIYDNMSKEEVQDYKDKAKRLDGLIASCQKRLVAELKGGPREYLTGERALTEDTIIEWGLGFGTDDWRLLSKDITEAGYFTLAKELGIIGSKEEHVYDKTRGKITFPLENHRGRIIGYATREFTEKESKKVPKWINPPENDEFNKSSFLFGWYRAKGDIREFRTAHITEGYLDVINNHQRGMCNVVSAGGTGITTGQLKELHKVTKRLNFLLDGDEAGIKAAYRILPEALMMGFHVSITLFPEGMDTDDWLRAHPKLTTLEIKAAYKEMSVEGFEWYLSKKKLEKPESDELVDEIAPILKTLTNPIRKRAYTDHLIKELGLVEADILAVVGLEDSSAEKQKTVYTEDQLRDEIKLLQSADEDLSSIADTMAELIKNEDSPVRIAQYEKVISKELGISAKILGSLVRKKATPKEVQNLTEDDVRLPAGADRKFYDKYKFCFTADGYHFYNTNSGNVKQGTNFTIIPHFHIQSRVPGENKRLMTIQNKREELLVEMDSEALVSFPQFKKVVWDYGNFGFKPGTNTTHFDMLRDFLGAEFIPAKPLAVLGQQPEGFFAFSNGVVNESGEFTEIDDFGIVRHLDEYQNVLGEDVKHDQHYFLPAFSKLNKGVRADEDNYETERKLVYKKSEVSIDEWMGLFMKAFGKEKGMLGLTWLVAACFRSIFLKELLFFPLLFGYGETGSGKSVFGKILQNFFFHNQMEFSLKSGTDSGMSRRLGQVTDAAAFLDEFNDFIHEERFNHLKNAWGGIGREIGRATHNNKTRTIKVTVALYIAGQYMSSHDDHALTNRSVLLEFLKQDHRPEEQISAFNKLKDLMNKGVSSLVADILTHRAKVAEAARSGFNTVKNSLREELKGQHYEERVVDNYSLLIATAESVHGVLKMPFDLGEFKALCKEKILQTSDLITDTEGVSKFWRKVVRLSQDGELRIDRDFQMETPVHVGIRENSRKQITQWSNKNDEEVVYINWGSVYDRYRESDKMEAIDKSTLKGMLNARLDTYIGRKEKHNFPNYGGSAEALLFRYKELQEAGFTFNAGSKQPKTDEVLAGDKSEEDPF